QDYNEAVRLYREAAQRGIPASKYHLGYCYENGLGVDKDMDQAVKLYRESADAEPRSAQALKRLGY
ncbi:MAG: sel1 repeat family protein, partial [Bacteroidales bacterium]|nr:sel1 repeat family protein [Bacteroidales bacterium]